MNTKREINKDLEHKRNLLRIKRQNLQELQLQEAKYGGIDVPLRIRNQINEHITEIETLEAEIAELKEALSEFEVNPVESSPSTDTVKKNYRITHVWLWVSISGIILIIIFLIGAYIIRDTSSASQTIVDTTTKPTITETTIPTTTPTSLPTKKGPCPDRNNIEGSEQVPIEVPDGYVAYFVGWMFDGEDGGFFITINGPYNSTHTFRDGVYCPPILANTEQAQTTIELLKELCASSNSGCSQEKTLP